MKDVTESKSSPPPAPLSDIIPLTLPIATPQQRPEIGQQIHYRLSNKNVKGNLNSKG